MKLERQHEAKFKRALIQEDLKCQEKVLGVYLIGNKSN